MLALLKYASIAVGPWTKMAPAQYENLIKYDILFMEEMLTMLHGIRKSSSSESTYGFGEDGDQNRADMAALRALRQLLDRKDPQQDWGGLRKVQTPEGHYLWLCEYHAREYSQ